MINCNYLEVDEKDTFDTIINEKYRPCKTRLLAIQSNVNDCYDKYLDDFENTQSEATSVFTIEEDKQCLNNCYTSRTASFKVLRGEIFSKQPDILIAFCPYCLIDSPKTLDHYISESEFPEYSILVKNLIPCCHDCNIIKKIRWRLNNRRRYIHFHNDTFIENQFLHCHITKVDNVPKIDFNLVRPNQLSNEQFEIVCWHFEDLNLLSRYTDRSNTLVSTEISILKLNKRAGRTEIDLAGDQRNRGAVLAQEYGVNYWKAVLHNALADSINLILEEE